MKELQTPDVTLVQKLVAAGAGLVGAVLTALAAFGVALDAAQISAILGLYTALGGVFVIADAVIRNGRAKMMATKITDEDLGL